ncbi:MAG TPA: GldG family protein [Terriglobia bacterium]|nr:GldG family protein [Terriglobia bacterium]
MTESEISKSKGGGKILGGVNLAVYTVVGIAILTLANWFVSRHDQRWDFTPNQKYSLSPQTVKFLKGLKQDVGIYVFDQERSMRAHHDLLDNYAVQTNHLSVHYVDPDRQPSLARQYAVRTDGTIVVVAGDRHFEAKSADEEGVTNALVRVLKGEKTIYFIQGHGERDLESTERGGYDHLVKEFGNENFEAKPLVLLQKMEIPSDCALLVIAGPHNDYLPQEVDLIRKFVGAGGRAMFMLDPGVDLPNLSALLSDWNVSPQNDLVIDLNPVAQIFGAEPTMPLIIKYGISPITQPLARTASLFPLTRSFSIGKDAKAGVSTDSLCETSGDSYGIADFDPKVRTITVGFRAGKDFKGPLPVAVSGTVTGGANTKIEGRFVALGTSSIAANVYLGFQGNKDLFMNMVSWLAQEEDLISIRPKPADSQHLNVTPSQMSKILILGVLGLPLLIIFVGTVVWWQRR